MLGDEVELLLNRAGTIGTLQQVADVTQPVAPWDWATRQASSIVSAAMAVGQADQPHDRAEAVDATLADQIFSPAPGVGTDGAGLAEPPGRAAFDPAALLGGDVLIVGGEPPRLTLGMNSDLPKVLVEQPNYMAIPTRPRPGGRQTPAARSSRPWPPLRAHRG